MKIELDRAALFALQCVEEAIRRATPRSWGPRKIKNNPDWIGLNILEHYDDNGVYSMRIGGPLHLKAGNTERILDARVTLLVMKRRGNWFAHRLEGELSFPRHPLDKDRPNASPPPIPVR